MEIKYDFLKCFMWDLRAFWFCNFIYYEIQIFIDYIDILYIFGKTDIYYRNQSKLVFFIIITLFVKSPLMLNHRIFQFSTKINCQISETDLATNEHKQVFWGIR